MQSIHCWHTSEERKGWQVSCPDTIILYNKDMRGVDRGDQKRGCYSCRTESKVCLLFLVWIAIIYHLHHSLWVQQFFSDQHQGLLYTTCQPACCTTAPDADQVVMGDTFPSKWRMTTIQTCTREGGVNDARQPTNESGVWSVVMPHWLPCLACQSYWGVNRHRITYVYTCTNYFVNDSSIHKELGLRSRPENTRIYMYMM